jgi:predicted esterase
MHRKPRARGAESINVDLQEGFRQPAASLVDDHCTVGQMTLIMSRLILLLSLSAFMASATEPVITPGGKRLPLPGEAFQFDGHDAFVILPPDAGKDTPWVWYAPTLPGLPGKEEAWMFERFSTAGVAIAGIDVGESFGSPDGRATYSAFYRHLIEKRGLSRKTCLLARSRGGLMLYSWAAENPDKVNGIAGIYPVCNIASYPGVKRACGAYGLSAQQLEADLHKHNPVDRLAPLAKAKVPIWHIHGDKDGTVPLDANSALLAERYKKLGGTMTLEIVKGGGHDMRQEWFHSQKLVDFVVACTTSRGPAE